MRKLDYLSPKVPGKLELLTKNRSGSNSIYHNVDRIKYSLNKPLKVLNDSASSSASKFEDSGSRDPRERKNNFLKFLIDNK